MRHQGNGRGRRSYTELRRGGGRAREKKSRKGKSGRENEKADVARGCVTRGKGQRHCEDDGVDTPVY